MSHANIRPSRKPEVHNVSQRRESRTDSRPQTARIENSVQFGHVVLEICARRYRQRDRQIDRQVHRSISLRYRRRSIKKLRYAEWFVQRECFVERWIERRLDDGCLLWLLPWKQTTRLQLYNHVRVTRTCTRIQSINQSINQNFCAITVVNGSKLISAYGCMDFSSYFQVGSESRSVGLGLSRRPPSADQAPLAALRGSLGLDSCPT